MKIKFKSELLKNSSIALSGNLIGQVIALAVYPLVTRIYSKADFGIFASYMTVCSILTIIGTGRYEETLVIAKNENEKRLLLCFSLKWLVLFSSLLFLTLYVFGNKIFAAFNLNEISDFWFYIPISVLIAGIINLLNNLAVRKKQFKTIAAANVVQNSANAASKLIFGSFSITKLGLIVSNIIALTAAGFTYLRTKKLCATSLHTSSLRNEISIALKYRDFPTYNLGRNLLSQVSGNLPFLLLLGSFGAEKLGLYSLAFFAVSTPVNLLANSFFSTFFEKISSSIAKEETIFAFMKNYWKGLIIWLLPIFVLAFFIAEPLFGFFFGTQWTEAGMYFKILLPWLFMVLITSPLHSVFYVFNLQKKTTIAEIIYLLIRFLAIYSGICFGDFMISILSFSLVGFLYGLFYMNWIFRIVVNYEKKLR